MSWREIMDEHFDPYTQYTQKPQKVVRGGSFEYFEDIEDKGQKLKSEDFDSEIEEVIHELDRVWGERGTQMNDIPRDRRQRAFDLERRITQAVHAGNVAGFRDAVELWQRCWIS